MVASGPGVGDSSASAVRFAVSRSGHGIDAMDAAVASNGDAVNCPPGSAANAAGACTTLDFKPVASAATLPEYSTMVVPLWPVAMSKIAGVSTAVRAVPAAATVTPAAFSATQSAPAESRSDGAGPLE